MANETQTNIISVQIDEQAKNKLIKGLQDVRAEQKRVAVENTAMGKSAEETAKQIAALRKEERALEAVLKAIDGTIDKQAKSFDNATVSANSYESQLKAIKEGGADRSGDLASAFGGIRGASSAVGLGGVTDIPLNIAEAAADLGEFLPKLKVGLEATAASGSGLISTVSGLAASALPAAGASFGAVAVALAPIVLAGAAVAGGLALVSAGLDQASKAAARQAEAQTAANEAVNRAIGEGQTTGEALQSSVDIANEIDITYQNLLDAQAEYESYLQERGGNALQALADGINVFGDREQVLADAVQRNREEYERLTTQYNELNIAVAEGEFAANDTAAAEAELARVREEESKRAIQVAEQNAQRIAQLENQRASLAENRAIQQANADEIEAVNRRFAQQDAIAKTVEHNQELLGIYADGLDRIKAVNQEIASLPAKQAQAESEAQTKKNDALDKLNQDYFESQIKATQDYNLESQRIAKDTGKAIARLREDIEDSLSDAYASNDVAAFLRIQREGQKELKRNAEDAGEEEKRRAEDFVKGQEEQRVAFQQRTKEILTGYEQERQKIAQNFNEQRKQLEQQRLQELNNTQQAISNAQARFQQEQALAQQTARREAELAAIRERQELAAFNRQVNAINAQIAGIGTVETSFLSAVGRIASAAGSIGSSSMAYKGSSASAFYNKTSGSTGGAFSRGTGGSAGVTVNVNGMQVGDIATGKQVSAAINQVAGTIYETFMAGIQKGQQ